MFSAPTLKSVLVMVLCIQALAPHTKATLTCKLVDSTMTLCLKYMRGKGSLTTACCKGLSSVNKAAYNTVLRKKACNCFKQDLSKLSGIISANAEGLPKKCGVNISYKISSSTNCANTTEVNI